MELLEAIDARDLERVRALLEQGADPDAPDEEGRVPLEVARRNADDAIADLLVAHGATVRL